MTKNEKKVASVIPGEYTCQIRFNDGYVLTVITDGHGAIEAPTQCSLLPSGDPADPPEGYVATAEKLALAAFVRKANIKKSLHKGRIMSGRGVDS